MNNENNEEESKKDTIKKELDDFRIKMINGTIAYEMCIASGLVVPIAGYFCQDYCCW